MRFLLLGTCLSLSCAGPHPPPQPPLSERRVATIGILAAVDLPAGDPRCRELSGIAWDPRRRILWAISDRTPELVPLSPSDDWQTWTVGAPIDVRVPDPWDGEGIAIAGGQVFIANEAGGHIYALDWSGAQISELPLPRHFGLSVLNKSLESLSATPDGGFLFTANESALTCDGAQPDAQAGSVVRILRHSLTSGTNVEHAYRTDPIFAPGAGGDMGVADLVALSEAELLVLERGFVPGVGNAIRLYRAEFAGDDVIDLDTLGAGTKAMKKTLVTTFGDVAGASVVPKRAGGARFPNYEGMALGPGLPDGGRALFVVSDDNAREDQITRVLVLRLAE